MARLLMACPGGATRVCSTAGAPPETRRKETRQETEPRTGESQQDRKMSLVARLPVARLWWRAPGGATQSTRTPPDYRTNVRRGRLRRTQAGRKAKESEKLMRATMNLNVLSRNAACRTCCASRFGAGLAFLVPLLCFPSGPKSVTAALCQVT